MSHVSHKEKPKEVRICVSRIAQGETKGGENLVSHVSHKEHWVMVFRTHQVVSGVKTKLMQ